MYIFLLGGVGNFFTYKRNGRMAIYMQNIASTL